MSLLELGLNEEYGVTTDLFYRFGRIYDKNTLVLKANGEGSEIFLIIDGKIFITRHKQDRKYQVIKELGPGEIFGRRASQHNAPVNADYVAATHTKLLIFTYKEFEQILRKHPRWAFKILTALGNRIQQNFARIEENQTA